jgi:RNA recognition motif-containing protein
MAKKLYVGNLPYSVTADSLRDKFSALGEVTSSTIISDKFSGRSKGFGFVEMANDDEAAKAISELHEADWEGRKMIVNEARPLEDRPKRDFRGPRA